MGFPRQDYWSELPFPSPGDLPNPGVEPALAGGFFTTGPPGKPQAHPAQRKIPQQSQGFAFRSLWCVEMSTRAWAFSRGPHFPFFFFKYVFIYFWLHWIFITVCRLYLVVGSLGFSLVAVLSFLTAAASLVMEHKLSVYGIWA